MSMKRFFLLLMMVAVMGAYGCQAGSNDQAADAESAGDQAAMVEDSQPESQVEKVKPQEVSKDESKEEKKVENPIVERSLSKDPGPAAEMARMKTNHGDIVIRFYPKQAPLAVANFKGLAAKGYYDGVTFHRVIKNFMIQGGDPTASGRGGQSIWGGKFEDEFDATLRFDRPGILAMANAGPATNGSQFFITEVPTPHLNDRHTIFGEVAEGFDVVQKICAVQVKPGDKPVEPVVIEGIEIYTP